MRSEDPPAEGTDLVSEDGSFRGRVQRIFGPVARPYLIVQPRRPLEPSRALALVGQRLWTEVRNRAR